MIFPQIEGFKNRYYIFLQNNTSMKILISFIIVNAYYL